VEDGPEIAHWTSAFSVLSDPTRFRLLLLLHGAESLTTAELVRDSGRTPETVSYALRLLRMYGVVESHRERRGIRHRLAPHAVTDLLADVVARTAAPAPV
jgi:ArsR family transcriptional regulator, lead/cadmium/zinc/bismuth-responsive transcriptional repressor